MRTPQDMTKWVMLGAMLLAMPCFVLLGPCIGFLPLGVTGLFFLVGFARTAGSYPFSLIIVLIFVLAIAQVAVYVLVFYKLAALLARSMVRASQTWHIRMLAAVVALVAAAMVLPTYSFACTHGTSRCTVLAMYADFYRTLVNPHDAWMHTKCGFF